MVDYVCNFSKMGEEQHRGLRRGHQQSDSFWAKRWRHGHQVEPASLTTWFTIFAPSALITMDTEGDFQRAILQSGTLARPFFLQGLEDDRVAQVEEFGERLGCSGETMVDCLRGKPVSELVAASAMATHERFAVCLTGNCWRRTFALVFVRSVGCCFRFAC